MLSGNHPRPVLILALLAGAACCNDAVAAEFSTLPAATTGSGSVPWHHDIATARAAAAASGRQAIVIFTAPWNEPCSRFESALGTSIEATTLLGACFEPVRINVSEDPWTTRRMGVSNVPAACIIDDRENVLVRFECPQTAEGFVAAVCKASRDATLAAIERTGSQQQAATTDPAAAIAGGAADAAGDMPLPSTAELLGLEGYCPVCLVTRQSWVEGNAQITETHKGQTYCFAGEAERRAFQANPEWYAPALGGDDAVLAAKQGVIVAGRRAYSAAYKSRLYLFASPDTRNAFVSNPEQYVRRAQIARGSTPGGRVVR